MSTNTTLTEEDLDAMLGELEVPNSSTTAGLPDDELVAALETTGASEPATPAAPVDDAIAGLESDLEALEAEVVVEVPPVVEKPAESVSAPVKATDDREAHVPLHEDKVAVTGRREEGMAVKPADSATAIKAFVDSDELKRDVRINPVDLDNAMIEHASLFVHYASQAVKARSQYDRVKNGFEILEAKLDAEHRERFASEGKKVTEAQIKAAMTADPRWSKGQAMVIEAHGIWKLADIAQSAFDQRKDLLLEVARDRRKEKEGQMRVLEGQAQRDRVSEILSRAA